MIQGGVGVAQGLAKVERRWDKIPRAKVRGEGPRRRSEVKYRGMVRDLVYKIVQG